LAYAAKVQLLIRSHQRPTHNRNIARKVTNNVVICHGIISNVAYLQRSSLTRNQMNNTTRTPKHGGVKQWFTQLSLTLPTLPLFDKLRRTGVTREGYEERRAAGVRRRTRQDTGRTMDEEVQGSASELDSGAAGRLRRRGQWATVDKEYGPARTMGENGRGQWTSVARVSRSASKS
jgi:hypothetical protein